MGYRLETLSKSHIRSEFDCGNEQLNHYLNRIANQDMRRKHAVCYVLVNNSRKVLAFFTLSAHTVERQTLVGRLSKRSLGVYEHIPVTLLGRLAVDKQYKGQGIGEFMLLSAMEKALLSSNTIASSALVVEAIDNNARQFYQSYGFIELQLNKLYLTFDKIKELLK
jgi:predicted GNAT family N-acyltransferase